MGKAFLQLFMRGNPAALKAVQGFGAKAAPQAIKRAADTVTNPQTYRALAAQAENVLQRGLPGQFAGPNFGNIPARFTGLISDVAEMPAGIQRSAQAGIVNRAIQEAAGSVPQLARAVQQYATGALKAPVIGDTVQAARQVATGIQGTLTSPTGFGGPFMRDPALRREFLKQFGGTSEKAARALSGNTAIDQVGANARYLQRQAQTGLQTGMGQVGSIYRNLQGVGPTALNPLATRTPTTLLGKAGKFFNPLNPVNAGGYLTGGLISTFIPEGDPNRGNLELLAYTPGGLLPKIAATTIFGATSAGVSDQKEAELIRQSLARGGKQIGAKNTQGQYWAGENWGYQSPESFNKLYGTKLPTGGVSPPPPPNLFPPNQGAELGSQAGQQTPPPPSQIGTGVLSNGAGVPAQRENVFNRALSQEILNAAQQYAAPTNVPLPSLYEGQQQLGRSMMQKGNLASELQALGAGTGMAPENFQQWVKANPGLAYREMLRLKQM